MRIKLAPTITAMCLVGVLPTAAWGQTSDIRSEIQQKYDAALAATRDPAIVQANDSRFIWASQAKAQCGIALGFFKSGTQDETSIGKCRNAYDLMVGQPAPPSAPPPAPPAPPAPPQAPICTQQTLGQVFFDFDSSAVSDGARETVEAFANNARACNWQSIAVVGHADRAGSNAYNMGLSQRRAQSVAAMLVARGVPAANVTTTARGEEQSRVPTADGVREPQNRRVEMSAR